VGLAADVYRLAQVCDVHPAGPARGGGPDRGGQVHAGEPSGGLARAGPPARPRGRGRGPSPPAARAPPGDGGRRGPVRRPDRSRLALMVLLRPVLSWPVLLCPVRGRPAGRRAATPWRRVVGLCRRVVRPGGRRVLVERLLQALLVGAGWVE